jgi:hypothetical protein
LVATNASARRPFAASNAPVVSSARPYIGELSITLPPASSSASTTPGSSAYAGVPGRLVEADVGAAADHRQRLAGRGIGRVCIFAGGGDAANARAARVVSAAAAAPRTSCARVGLARRAATAAIGRRRP